MLRVGMDNVGGLRSLSHRSGDFLFDSCSSPSSIIDFASQSLRLQHVLDVLNPSAYNLVLLVLPSWPSQIR